jgi:hypothetical protein
MVASGSSVDFKEYFHACILWKKKEYLQTRSHLCEGKILLNASYRGHAN